MTAEGQELPSRGPRYVRSSADSGAVADVAALPRWANAQNRTLPKLFDHLVSAADHRERDSEVERRGGLHVDDQFDFCCLLNR